jgi:hypothetical protein
MDTRKIRKADLWDGHRCRGLLDVQLYNLVACNLAYQVSGCITLGDLYPYW